MAHDICLQSGRYFGHVDHAITRADLLLTITSYPPGACLPRHHHQAPYLCAVLAGRYEEVMGSRTETCSPGAVLFHPAGAEHADRFGRHGGSCLNVQFGPGWNRRLELSGLSQLRSTYLGQVAEPDIRRLRDEMPRSGPVADLAIEGLVLTLLTTVAREPAAFTSCPEPAWVRLAAEWLEANPAAPPTLEEMGKRMDLSPIYLARAFKASTGCTPAGYVRRLRVERARARLRESNVPLAELAAELGYSDQAHFTRQFRQATGRPPGAYRRHSRG
jgi:AraC family transcriptional regulator